jgi:serine palmitoyltransferase
VGQLKIKQLRENSNYFREELIKMGLHVYGAHDSPIVPMLIYFPAKVAEFSRMCLSKGIAVVVVGFPATSVILSRARFCLSASHTRKDLEYAVTVIKEVAEELGLLYAK